MLSDCMSGSFMIGRYISSSRSDGPNSLILSCHVTRVLKQVPHIIKDFLEFFLKFLVNISLLKKKKKKLAATFLLRFLLPVLFDFL